jgi:hypothetical protein
MCKIGLRRVGEPPTQPFSLHIFILIRPYCAVQGWAPKEKPTYNRLESFSPTPPYTQHRGHIFIHPEATSSSI